MDQPMLEGYNDHFGGISGLQDIVSNHYDCDELWQEQAYKGRLGKGADRRIFTRSPHQDAETRQ
jgi:hypothetical protein